MGPSLIFESSEMELAEIDSDVLNSVSRDQDSANGSSIEGGDQSRLSDISTNRSECSRNQILSDEADSLCNRTIDASPHKDLKFVKSIRTSCSTRSGRGTASPPVRPNSRNFSPGRVVHSVHPVPNITNVRTNRAYELRFTENAEHVLLRQARQVSYCLYISTARILKRTPEVQLGAGFP
ncbi:uncharacterized protein LOC100898077 [Galendromus occidentalis]|uniref:Uncharacterized protein LOC100898077 n=1 Tax=Galendromus occidentalis TaxID=34638 RepID=A0AAJ6VYQ5_9ACAR|nr:uncharacterized protein LOC100898077 [Galendromus occidentalis]